MTEPEHKKTMLVWRPPAAADATQQGIGGAAAVTPAPEMQADPSPSGEPDHVSTPATLGATVQASAGGAVSGEHPARRRDPTQPLVAGDVIGGRYVVKSLAGQGGFAGVYRATHREIPNHEVAVKLLNAQAESPEARETALRELTLIASVSHPSVVQFKDYGWHEGRLFFAMPWYRGKTLSSAAPLDRADARRVFERCAYGLQAMHDAGICHYDIKPDNIFLADIEGFDAGFPVLLDLGIAAKRGERPTALTPDYASPETAQSILNGGGTPVGTAADVFALALSLRNVLEPGTMPELGESLPAFLHQRSTVPISPPTRKDLRYLKPLFERWLSLDPSERPSAAEFALQLAALTAPEERRAERKRLLMRVVPVVFVLGLIATVLALQLKTTTKELVEQKQEGEKQSQAANERFVKLKAESKDQLDEKLQLAQEFQSQRDQIKKTLDVTSADRDRVRSDLKARTRERDQTKSDLAAQTQVLQGTKSALDQKTQEAADRTRELAQARGDLQAKTQDLAQRTKERDRAQSDLAKQAKAVQDAQQALASLKAALAAQSADVAAKTTELQQLTKERDKTKAELDKRTHERDAARNQVKALVKQLADQTQQLEEGRRAAAAAAAADKAALKAERRKAAAPN